MAIVESNGQLKDRKTKRKQKRQKGGFTKGNGFAAVKHFAAEKGPFIGANKKSGNQRLRARHGEARFPFHYGNLKKTLAF